MRGRFPSAVFGGSVVYVCSGHILGGYRLFLFAIFVSEFTPCSVILFVGYTCLVFQA